MYFYICCNAKKGETAVKSPVYSSTWSRILLPAASAKAISISLIVVVNFEGVGEV